MIFIYLIRFPAGVGCTGSSSWMPFLGWDLVTTMVTTMVTTLVTTMVTTLLAAAAVQRPDLSLNVTLAPEPVTVIVVMVVIVIMLAPAIMVIMMMVVVVFAGLLSGRRHDGSGALLLHNHARSGVNALHSRERFKQFIIICARGFYYNIVHLADLESCLSIPLLESCLSSLDRDSCLLFVKSKIRF